MEKIIVFTVVTLMTVQLSFSQTSGNKKSVKQVIEDLPEMLIAQPDAVPDSNANKLINDNLSIVIPPVWREKGLHTLIEFKLAKTDKEPVMATMPAPVRTQDLVITMSTVKKTPEERKQLVLNSVKGHVVAYFKELQTALSSADADAKLKELVTGPEQFTTTQGRSGELYYIQDIQSNQSSFIILLLMPADKPGFTHHIQFTYSRFTYENNLPEDILEMRAILYKEDEDNYINFTKNILKSFWVR